MATNKKVYNFRKFRSSKEQIDAKINSQALDDVIRYPNRYTTAKPGEFVFCVPKCGKINGYSIRATTIIKQGTNNDTDGRCKNCTFYLTVIYNEYDGYVNENAVIFASNWNPKIDFINKMDQIVPANGLQRIIFNGFIADCKKFKINEVRLQIEHFLFFLSIC